MKRMNGIRILPGVKKGPADCVRNDEVAAALKRMKTKPQVCQG